MPNNFKWCHIDKNGMSNISPALYNIVVFISTLYCMVSIIKVWIARVEGKITNGHRHFFNFCYGFLLISMWLFSISFAVQPIESGDVNLQHKHLIVHTFPWMTVQVGLTLAQVRMSEN